jgi:acyl-CoA synthetase (AMP-forming)/AMP-acid ligase II
MAVDTAAEILRERDAGRPGRRQARRDPQARAHRLRSAFRTNVVGCGGVGAKTVNCYGMTETANWFAGASSHDGIAEGPLGAPWEGEAALRDEGGAMWTSGEGEIVVRSAALMSSYLDRPDLTAAVLAVRALVPATWAKSHVRAARPVPP